LRLAEGVDLADIAQRTGMAESALINPAAARQLSQHGLIRQEASHLNVLPDGMLLLDRILAELVAA